MKHWVGHMNVNLAVKEIRSSTFMFSLKTGSQAGFEII